MRSIACLSALPLIALSLALAGCGSSAPQQTPVVINTPPPVTAAVPPAPPSTPADSGLVTQCQSLFARTLGSQPVNYASPAVASAGGSTTIHLAAQPLDMPQTPPIQYTCSFSGTALTSAGAS